MSRSWNPKYDPTGTKVAMFIHRRWCAWRKHNGLRYPRTGIYPVPKWGKPQACLSQSQEVSEWIVSRLHQATS